MRRIAAAVFVLGACAAERPARADDKAACIAAFDAGQQSRAAGKLTQALTQLAVCARDVCPRSLQRACVEAASEVDGLLPSIVLSATDGSRVELTDVKVSIDGVVVATALDGKAMPLDPGIHTFRFERAGLPAVERSFPVLEGQRGQPITVQLGRTSAPSTRLRWVGVGVGAAGVVGIVLGSVFGATAFSEYKTAKDATLDSAFSSARSSGETDATISTAAFIAGGALVAAGVTLIVLTPKSSATTATLVPGAHGLSLVGTF